MGRGGNGLCDGSTANYILLVDCCRPGDHSGTCPDAKLLVRAKLPPMSFLLVFIIIIPPTHPSLGTDVTPAPDGSFYRFVAKDRNNSYTSTRFYMRDNGLFNHTHTYTNRRLSPGDINYSNAGECACDECMCVCVFCRRVCVCVHVAPTAHPPRTCNTRSRIPLQTRNTHRLILHV